MKTFKPPAQIMRRIRNIPEPSHYYTGIPFEPFPLPANILLFCRRTRATTPTRISLHHRHVLILNLQTRGSVLLEQHLVDFRPGEALLIMPYQYHNCAIFDHERLNWLFVTFEMDTPPLLQDLRDHPVPVPADAWPLCREIIDLFLATDHNGPRQRIALSLALGSMLCQLAEAAPPPVPPAAQSSRVISHGEMVVRDACRFINDSLQTAIHVDDVASAVGLSPSRLRQVFRATIGMSLGRYLRETRLFRAAKLLRHTDMTISAIATACGFESIYSFSRTFRQETRQTPTAFRNDPTLSWLPRHTHRP
ncbi:MAG: hypothetical protein A2498_13830 [Lentisphaerae bacterium RIFOXYC12_FULL_60_16]|nr:MAG: hypothetical protein A2498_13830 [Lentisphaerae bacterium RIFOXYC12_FULL_60_16]OGV86714.1 MAG: hypothetical protein A2340_10565 [Lentisphaerae bacterium RIFOXYB12_FULL_60_10]